VKPLSRSGMDHTVLPANACLYPVSVHQMALPLTGDSVGPVAAYYSSIDPKGWKAELA